MRAAALMLAAVAAGAAIQADAAPRRAAFAEVRSLAYDPAAVVTLCGRKGRHTVVELGARETIRRWSSGAGSGPKDGEPQAWQINAFGSRFTVQLLGYDDGTDPASDLSVFTDRNLYLFKLQVCRPWHLLTFTHGATAQAPAAALAAASPGSAGAPAPAAPRNLRYSGQGAAALEPAGVSDDGTLTRITFKPGQERPAVFRIAADSAEALVHGKPEGDAIVIAGTAAKFVLRLGASVYCIFNEAAR